MNEMTWYERLKAKIEIEKDQRQTRCKDLLMKLNGAPYQSCFLSLSHYTIIIFLSLSCEYIPFNLRQCSRIR